MLALSTTSRSGTSASAAMIVMPAPIAAPAGESTGFVSMQPF